MPAYFFAIRKGPILDQDAMNEYQKRTAQMKNEIRATPLIVYGATEALEGEAPDGSIMLQFDSKEDALAWYNNPGYQAAVPFRQKAAHYDVYIVEGFKP